MTVLSSHEVLAMLLFSMMSVLNSKSMHNVMNLRHDVMVQRTESSNGAILGRPVQIPARDYTLMSKVESPKLGDCALSMRDGHINTCTGKFGGSEKFIPASSTHFDVSKVENTLEILNHAAGNVGVNVGILGLSSAGLKTELAATIQTSTRHLTLISSYEVQRGALTLQNPYPLTDVNPEGELYLSDIVIGSNELVSVTMEFESTQKKVEVEKTMNVTIFFNSIAAKIRFVQQTFKPALKTRVQFKSSWRPHVDNIYASLEDAIKEVERIEEMYARGAIELANMDIKDSRARYIYYFTAWNKLPFGEETNMDVMHNDLNVLTQQNIEAQAVIHRIAEVSKLESDTRKLKEMKELKNTVSNIHAQLDKGIKSYHILSTNKRIQLREIYGEDKIPEYYGRQLQHIMGY